MLLKEIKELEYKLLLLEQNVLNINFTDYLTIENYLDKIGKITLNYINYMEKYSKLIDKNNIKEKLIEKNNQLLNTEIQLNSQELENIQKLLEKYTK